MSNEPYLSARAICIASTSHPTSSPIKIALASEKLGRIGCHCLNMFVCTTQPIPHERDWNVVASRVDVRWKRKRSRMNCTDVSRFLLKVVAVRGRVNGMCNLEGLVSDSHISVGRCKPLAIETDEPCARVVLRTHRSRGRNNAQPPSDRPFASRIIALVQSVNALLNETSRKRNTTHITRRLNTDGKS